MSKKKVNCLKIYVWLYIPTNAVKNVFNILIIILEFIRFKFTFNFVHSCKTVRYKLNLKQQIN